MCKSDSAWSDCSKLNHTPSPLAFKYWSSEQTRYKLQGTVSVYLHDLLVTEKGNMKGKMCHPLLQNDWQVYKTKPNSTIYMCTMFQIWRMPSSNHWFSFIIWWQCLVAQDQWPLGLSMWEMGVCSNWHFTSRSEMFSWIYVCRCCFCVWHIPFK